MRRIGKNRKRRAERQEDAQDRKELYNELTIAEKIEKLDKELGKKIGAKKQRAKLAMQTEKIKPVKSKKEKKDAKK